MTVGRSYSGGARRSLDKGRRTEREVARRLTRWAAGWWIFRRRGLGHAGLPDLLAAPGVLNTDALPWPFVLSVKAGRAPTLATLLAWARTGMAWQWWQEVASAAPEPGRAWLVWKSGPTWLLSCGALWGLSPPPTFSLFAAVSAIQGMGTVASSSAADWPRFTMVLDALLEATPPEKVAEIARLVAAGVVEGR